MLVNLSLASMFGILMDEKLVPLHRTSAMHYAKALNSSIASFSQN